MEKPLLADKLKFPDKELVFAILGDNSLLWKQTFSYLNDRGKDISVNWSYSNCGKYWVCQAQKKKKTIFRVRIHKRNSFDVAFPVGDKLEPVVMGSSLPASIKTNFEKAKKYNTTRYISIEVEDSMDLESIKKLIDIKLDHI